MMRLVDDMLKEESLPARWTATYEQHNDRWLVQEASNESRLVPERIPGLP